MKLIDLTPRSIRCGVGPCPAIYKTERNTFVVIGTILGDREAKKSLQGKIGEGEAAVEVPEKLLHGFLENSA